MREGVQRQGREKSRVARTGSDEPNGTGIELRETKKRAVDHYQTASEFLQLWGKRAPARLTSPSPKAGGEGIISR